MRFGRAIATALVAAVAPPPALSFLLPPFHPFVAPAPDVCQRRARPAQPLRRSSTDIAEDAASASAPPTIIEGMPSNSPATSLPNRIYEWRGYSVRYQVSGPPDADHTLLLVHGLFVNSDHWRKMLTGLQENGKGCRCRVYALDLLGSGWSSKPSRDDPQARMVSGENGRFVGCDSVCYHQQQHGDSVRRMPQKIRSAPVLENVPLGTPAGGNRLAPALELRHPLGSPYNFYTWAEQIADFTNEVIRGDSDSQKKVTLVANSIGTISSFQSMIDEPDLFNGCFVINPNFRELHMAEVPFSLLTMPLVRQAQALLRERGHGLFEALATPKTVTQILKEPYKVTEVIDDELVGVLLDPLLTPGADDVVFDTLSYSAGPLPEQQLSSSNFPRDCPVWVVYGTDDPWLPSERVENLRYVCGRPGGEYGESPVDRVVRIEGAGHCPHDEVPERVNGLILEFLERLSD